MSTEVNPNNADVRLQQKQEVMGEGAEAPKVVMEFDREKRSWRFSFKAPDGEDFTYELTMKKSLFNTSLHLLKDRKDKLPSTLVTGKVVREDGSLAEAIFNMVAYIPNLWPKRDEHTVLSKSESLQLVTSVIRDANFEVAKRHLSDWFMNEINRSGAITFNLSVKEN